MKRSVIVFLLFVLVLAAVYSPAIYFNYLFHDDGSFWIKSKEYGFKHVFFDVCMTSCRYGDALLLNLEYFFIHYISDLKFLRFIGILFMGVNASLLFRQLRRMSFSTPQAFLAISAMFFLPEFAAMIFYSITAAYFPLCIFLSYWAFQRVEAGKGMFLPILFIFFAITIYQPLAMFYWTLTGMYLLFTPERSSVTFKRNIFRLMAAGFMGLLAYAISVFIMHYFFSHKIGHSLYNPYVITYDWPGKLTWFFKEPLMNALNLWNIYPKNSTSMIVAGFILLTAMTVTFKKGLSLNRLWQPGLFIVIFFLCFLPNLAARENAAFYRCLGPLSSLVWLMVVWAILKWMPPRGVTALLFIITAGAGITTFHNLLYGRVLPSSMEWSAYRFMAEEIHLKNMKAVHIILPRHDFSRERYDEFGVLSSHFPFDLYQMTSCAVNEVGKSGQSLPLIYFSYPDDPMVIELNEIFVKKMPDGRWIGRDINKDEPLHPINVEFTDNTMDHVIFPNFSPQPVSLKIKWYVLNLNDFFAPMDYNDTAVDAKTELAKAYSNRGNIYFRHGNLPQAIADYARAATLNPDLAESYYNLGIAFYREGLLPQALASFSRALAINPDDKMAYNNRAAIEHLLNR